MGPCDDHRRGKAGLEDSRLRALLLRQKRARCGADLCQPLHAGGAVQRQAGLREYGAQATGIEPALGVVVLLHSYANGTGTPWQFKFQGVPGWTKTNECLSESFSFFTAGELVLQTHALASIYSTRLP